MALLKTRYSNWIQLKWSSLHHSSAVIQTESKRFVLFNNTHFRPFIIIAKSSDENNKNNQEVFMFLHSCLLVFCSPFHHFIVSTAAKIDKIFILIKIYTKTYYTIYFQSIVIIIKNLNKSPTWWLLIISMTNWQENLNTHTHTQNADGMRKMNFYYHFSKCLIMLLIYIYIQHICRNLMVNIFAKLCLFFC